MGVVFSKNQPVCCIGDRPTVSITNLLPKKSIWWIVKNHPEHVSKCVPKLMHLDGTCSHSTRSSQMLLNSVIESILEFSMTCFSFEVSGFRLILRLTNLAIQSGHRFICSSCPCCITGCNRVPVEVVSLPVFENPSVVHRPRIFHCN